MAGGHWEESADMQIGHFVRLLADRGSYGEHFIVFGDVGGRRRSALVQVLNTWLAELILGQIDRGAARS